MHRIHVKNMVCRRCVMSVEDICARLGLEGARVSLGAVELPQRPDAATMRAFCDALREVGFEAIESDELVMLERVKAVIRSYARLSGARSLKLSAYIEDRMGFDFRNISRMFSALEGRTIQRYLTLQRIEYVKELLLDGALSLAEIADVAGFSSVAHLSTAFKKAVGITISDFVRSGGTRIGLDEV